MHYSQLAAEFLIEKYRFNQSDKQNLAQLFEAYKNPAQSQTQISDVRTAAAYMIARGLSISAVLAHILNTNAEFMRKINSIIDYGGGPGTFLWSFSDQKVPLQYINVDTNTHLLKVYRQLVEYFNFSTVATSVQKDYFQFEAQETLDLAVFSYTLCENKHALDAIKKASKFCDNLLIIEPGTPLGFNNILKAREFCIQEKLTLIAPCSQANQCPFTLKTDSPVSDWCHFITRNNRHKTQMFLKNAEKSYEDEKYIYLLASKSYEADTGKIRIISKPQVTPNAVSFKICTETAEEILISKKQKKTAYKFYKKSKRGDLFFQE